MSVDLMLQKIFFKRQVELLLNIETSEVFEMTKMDWQINIENLVARVAETYGSDVAASVFARYDATDFEDLNPAYYDQVFGDLMLIDADG